MGGVDVLVLTGNLMGSSRVAGVLRGHGLSVRVAREADGLTPDLAAQLRVVIWDLELPLDTTRLDELLLDAAVEKVAYGPHVDHARLEAARAAGWRVLTRGQFDASLPELARGWA